MFKRKKMMESQNIIKNLFDKKIKEEIKKTTNEILKLESKYNTHIDRLKKMYNENNITRITMIEDLYEYTTFLAELASKYTYLKYLKHTHNIDIPLNEGNDVFKYLKLFSTDIIH